MPAVRYSPERALGLGQRQREAALVFTGFGATVSQIILFREFLVGFYGSELSIGIFFAAWLFWVGAGSLFGNFIARRFKNLSSLLTLFLIAAPFFTVFQIVAIRFSRVVLSTPTGEYTPLFDLIWFCFAILSVGCMMWGILFTVGSKSLLAGHSAAWVGSNRGYLFESLGSAIGGILYSFILVRMFAPLQVLALTIFLGALTAAVLHTSDERTRRTGTIALVLLAVCFLFIVRPLVSLEREINERRWRTVNKSLTYVSSGDSKYQHLALLRLGGQHTIYTDGIPAFNIPNTHDAEVFVHSVMVHAGQLKRIAVLGGGFNGILQELLKYQVERVDYIEIDPAIIDIAMPVLPPGDIQSLREPRVRLIQEDARKWLEKTTESSDAIIVGVSEPSTASLNRYFTTEFYQKCRDRLNQGGIVVVSFPSSPDYLSDELKQLDASIYHTFKSVFANNLLVSGSRALLIGRKGDEPLVTAPDSLSSRFETAGISTQYFSPALFDEVFDASRREYVRGILESVQSPPINHDMNPVAYYFDMLLWNRFLKFNNRIFEKIGEPQVLLIVTALVLAAVGLISTARRQPVRRKKLMLAVIMVVGGLASMSAVLLILLNFQVTFGSIYEMVGAVVALNMLGLAGGAYLIGKVGREGNEMVLLRWSVLSVVAFLVALTPIMSALSNLRFLVLTLLLVFLAGGITGALYSSINRIFSRDSDSAGSVYALDVFGASLGSLLVFSILLPVLGSHGTCILLAVLLFSTGMIFRWTNSEV